MARNRKKETSEKETRKVERRRLRSAPERTATIRQNNSTITDGDKAVK